MFIAIAVALGVAVLAFTPVSGPAPTPVSAHKRVDHEGLATNRRFVYWLFQKPACANGADFYCTPPTE